MLIDRDTFIAVLLRYPGTEIYYFLTLNVCESTEVLSVLKKLIVCYLNRASRIQISDRVLLECGIWRLVKQRGDELAFTLNSCLCVNKA